jgi:hypothetical protein
MDPEPVRCPTCDVPMSPRRPLRAAAAMGRRPAPGDRVEPVTSWQCWACGRTRRTTLAVESPRD